MSSRNKIALILVVTSLILLYPGLFSPVLSISISTPELPMIGSITIYARTQSVVQSVDYLVDSGNLFVAFLILLFSIMVPIIKALLTVGVLFMKQPLFSNFVYRALRAIGKWAMADVFAVGILIAYLAMGSETTMNAHLEQGYYYFVGYCLVSLASIQVMVPRAREIGRQSTDNS